MAAPRCFPGLPTQAVGFCVQGAGKGATTTEPTLQTSLWLALQGRNGDTVHKVRKKCSPPVGVGRWLKLTSSWPLTKLTLSYLNSSVRAGYTQGPRKCLNTVERLNKPTQRSHTVAATCKDQSLWTEIGHTQETSRKPQRTNRTKQSCRTVSRPRC